MVRNTLLATAVTAVLLSAGAAQAAQTELAVNGGFETGDFTGWTQFPNLGTQEISTDNPASGTYSANLVASGNPTNSLIKQANVGVGIVNPGDEVMISFEMRGSTGDGGVVFAEFFSEVSGGGTSAAEILSGGPLFGSADWTLYEYTAIAGPDVSGGVTLQLGAVCGGASTCVSDIFIDNVSVSVSAVPVPAAAWLFGSALLGLGGLARKKRAA